MGRQEAGPLAPTWHVLLPRVQAVGCPPVSLHGHFRHRLSGGGPSSGTWRWGRTKKGAEMAAPDQYGTTPASRSSWEVCPSPYSLCPTRRSTFMPLVRHTPPCKLSRPSRVPSEVAGRGEPEGEVGRPESSPWSVPIPGLRQLSGGGAGGIGRNQGSLWVPPLPSVSGAPPPDPALCPAVPIM